MEQDNQRDYIDNAVRAVHNKKQVPEIDFTLHTMEDGTQVSTTDRVCKGTITLPDFEGRETEAHDHGTLYHARGMRAYT